MEVSLFSAVIRPLVQKCGNWTTCTGEELQDELEEIVHDLWSDYTFYTYPECEHGVQRTLDRCMNCEWWEKGMEIGKEIAKGEYE